MTEQVKLMSRMKITYYLCDTCGEGLMRLIQNWSPIKETSKYYYQCELCKADMWSDDLYDKMELKQ